MQGQQQLFSPQLPPGSAGLRRDPPFTHGQYRTQRSLSEIVSRMLATPGSQFHIYATDKVPPGRQREIVSYKGSLKRGHFRRSTMASSNGTVAFGQDLYAMLSQDVARFGGLFYTFTSSPVFGLASISENRSYLQNSQLLLPTPLSEVVID